MYELVEFRYGNGELAHKIRRPDGSMIEAVLPGSWSDKGDLVIRGDVFTADAVVELLNREVAR